MLWNFFGAWNQIILEGLRATGMFQHRNGIGVLHMWCALKYELARLNFYSLCWTSILIIYFYYKYSH